MEGEWSNFSAEDKNTAPLKAQFNFPNLPTSLSSGVLERGEGVRRRGGKEELWLPFPSPQIRSNKALLLFLSGRFRFLPPPPAQRALFGSPEICCTEGGILAKKEANFFFAVKIGKKHLALADLFGSCTV